MREIKLILQVDCGCSRENIEQEDKDGRERVDSDDGGNSVRDS